MDTEKIIKRKRGRPRVYHTEEYNKQKRAEWNKRWKDKNKDYLRKYAREKAEEYKQKRKEKEEQLERLKSDPEFLIKFIQENNLIKV